MFKIRDFVSKNRQITHFEHEKTKNKHELLKDDVSLHQKKDFNG